MGFVSTYEKLSRSTMKSAPDNVGSLVISLKSHSSKWSMDGASKPSERDVDHVAASVEESASLLAVLFLKACMSARRASKVPLED